MLPDRVAIRIAEAPFPVEQIRMDATRRLPFADQTFDGAVTTLTLCSLEIPSPPCGSSIGCSTRPGNTPSSSMGEVKYQGGRWQDRLNGLQRMVACGCNLNRRIDQLIQEGGFRIVELVKKSMPGSPG
jgi:hypothetical protein